jgi:hypothetical protein
LALRVCRRHEVAKWQANWLSAVQWRKPLLRSFRL